MPDQHPTASLITDPQLDALLAELSRLRSAVSLHRPRRTWVRGPVCQSCRKTWPCPTVRAAERLPTVAEAA